MTKNRRRRWRTAFRLLAGGLASAALTARVAAQDDAVAVREQFRSAYAAAALGTAGDDSEALRAYVLYPYVRAARLAWALGRAQGYWNETDVATAEFLAATGTAPVAQALHTVWLASLARRASWRAFLEQYDPAAATAKLECQRFAALIALDETAGLAAAVRARWLTGVRLPSDCEPAFQWLRAERELPDELVTERATLLLDNGQASFARVIAGRLPREAAAPLLERADFIESPARMLDVLLREESRVVPWEVVLDAWSRLARNAPAEALARYAALLPRAPTPDDAHALELALAKGLAWDRRPEALDHFARVPRAALDDTGIEWWARAAMWAGDWSTVRAAVAAMSPAQQSDWSWRYWAARAAEQLGENGEARALYTAALGGDNYYSAIAAARLDERVVPALRPIPLDQAQVEAIGAVDAFRRAHELALVGLRELATNEWHYAYVSLTADQQLQAVHLAARWGIYDVAVATATSHGRFNDYELLYPRPYADEIAAAVRLTDVDPHLLYGVLRQESLFRTDAASSAGALGMAQLNHATARETARRWALPVPRRAELFDAKVSITLGAARVAELLEEFDGQLPVALGAYNAGEAAAARWLPPRAIDSDVWIENIPYNETRAYVRRVLWHRLVFRWLETGRPQTTRDWLDKIASASDSG
jgi:soluble lytic murein transglycosylase